MDTDLVIQSIKNRIRNKRVEDTDKVLLTLIRCNINSDVNAAAQAILANGDILFDKKNVKGLLVQLQNLLVLVDRVGYKKAA